MHRQTPGGHAKRTTEPRPRNHPLDAEGSLCHSAQNAGGPRRDEPRGTHGRGVHSALRRRLSGAVKEQLATALRTSTPPARVRSEFDLPPEQSAAMSKSASNETFSADIHIQFETVPELVSGIELSTNGQKVAWSIADYLATLEKGAAELLREDARPESRQETQAKPEVEAGATTSAGTFTSTRVGTGGLGPKGGPLNNTPETCACGFRPGVRGDQPDVGRVHRAIDAA